MMVRHLLLAEVLLLLFFSSYAQSKIISFSLFNHATSLPLGTWAGALHPGFDVGLQTHLKQKARSEHFLHWKLGYFYHRLVHHGIQLYGEYQWNFDVYKRLQSGLSGGLGYFHSFEDHEIFRLSDNGTYEKTGRAGKAHVQISGAVNLLYRLENGWRPFVCYRFRLITPFVNEYVPVLPAVSVHAGVFFPLTLNRKHEI